MDKIEQSWTNSNKIGQKTKLVKIEQCWSKMTNLTKLNNLTKMNLSFENWTKLSKLKNQTNKVFQARFKEARLDAPAFKNGKKFK